MRWGILAATLLALGAVACDSQERHGMQTCIETSFTTEPVCRKPLSAVLATGSSQPGQYVALSGHYVPLGKLDIPVSNSEVSGFLFLTKEHADALDLSSAVTVGLLDPTVSASRTEPFQRVLATTEGWLEITAKLRGPEDRPAHPFSTALELYGVVGVTQKSALRFRKDDGKLE